MRPPVGKRLCVRDMNSETMRHFSGIYFACVRPSFVAKCALAVGRNSLSTVTLPARTVLHVEIDNGFHQNPVIVLSHSLCLVTDSTVRLRSCFLSNVYVTVSCCYRHRLKGRPVVVLSLVINTLEAAGFNPSRRTDYPVRNLL
jgi:hypothetical protein